MSDTAEPVLDNCGCCEDVPPETPISNPPGQPSLRYRIDTQPTFFKRMLAALPTTTVPPSNSTTPPTSLTPPTPLRALTARSLDDPAIALLDAWAVVADVLTFYQERIANEGFLRTATERRSVLELAREIGYELNPGVAASVDLAFTVEDATGAPRQAPVPVGTKVMSVPGPGETPQTFETIEAIVARPEWNAFHARTEDPEEVVPGMTDVFLAGTKTQLQIGDSILFVGDTRRGEINDNWDVRIISAVEPDNPGGRTRVAWREPLYTTAPARVYVFRKRASLFGHNAPQFRLLPTETKKAFNGTNEEDWGDVQGSQFDPSTDKAIASGQLDLDINDPKILAGSWIALAPGNQTTIPPFNHLSVPSGVVSAFPLVGLLPPPFPLTIGEDPPTGFVGLTPTVGVEAGLFQVSETVHPVVVSRTGYAITSQVTRVVVDNASILTGGGLSRRELQFLVESEQLAVGTRPILVPVDGLEALPEVNAKPDSDDFAAGTGNLLAVGLSVAGLQSGQKLALMGKRPNIRVVDAETLGARVSAYLLQNAGNGLEFLTQVVADLQFFMALCLDDPAGAQEPVLGHEFELLEPITEGDPPALTNYGLNLPLKRWKLRSRTGATGTATMPFFAVDSIPAPDSGETISEIRRIAEVFQGHNRMLLKLDKRLQFVYDRPTLTMSANVAGATHGETVSKETLGSGDPGTPMQTFTLKKAPLTYVASSDTPSGALTTLSVRVNNVLWRERPALLGQGPDDQVYTVRLTDDAQTNVIFGDGTNGSRLPSGTANILATYRNGIGLAGQVSARSLTLLATRPLGVRGVVNPLAAAGAEDPARIEDARTNAPLTVRTLDRVVSVGDVEDFSRAFAGVGKAQARVLWTGDAQVIHVTIGGADGQPITSDSPVIGKLAAALVNDGDPALLIPPGNIASYIPHTFRLTLQIDVDDRFEKQAVFDAVQAALLDAFSFANRQFGQVVNKSEIIGVAQQVAGVVAVNVASLSMDTPVATVPGVVTICETVAPDTEPPPDQLVVSVATFDGNEIIPAGLLTIDAAHLTLLDLTP
jgi:hypothetical protein